MNETTKTNAEIAAEMTLHIANIKDKLSKMSKDELKAECEYLCTQINEARLSDNHKTAKETEVFLDDAIKALNAECRLQCFIALKSTSNPILEACNQLSYTGYKHSEAKIEGTDATKCVVEEAQRSIDLGKLHDYLIKNKVASGVDPNWIHYIQRLNYQLTVRTIKELSLPEYGDDGKITKSADKVAEARIEALVSTYRMSDVSRDIKDGIDVSTNTKLGNALQAIVDAMIGEKVCKVRTQDVRRLIAVYTKEGRIPCSVRTAKHTMVYKFVKELIHAATRPNFQYEVEYDVVRK